MTDSERWRRCSVCKQPIALGAIYWVCNVSTCNQKRTALAFCTVDCWEMHLPEARHRKSWAVEKTAPRAPEETGTSEPAARSGSKRRIIASPRPSQSSASAAVPNEILIVASRLKDYVRARSGYNTSDRALGPLSHIVRRAVDEAIGNARREGRTTVMDRDVPER